MSEASRREVLAGTGGALATALLGASTASARAAGRAASPRVDVRPATPERALVVAHIPTGRLLDVRHGSTRRTQRSVAGLAVLGVPVPKNAETKLDIAIGSDSFHARVDTRAEALRTSLVRLVNKRVALSEKDEPKKLAASRGVMVDERIAEPLDTMIERAERDDIELEAVSAHRSFSYQKSLYERYVERDGKKAADTYSARPGHSEHQLGLAVDMRGADGEHELEPAFKHTPAGRWIAAHAHEFGFVVRYQDGQRRITGYEPEPWHLRYVGTDVARFLHARRDIRSLETLLGLPPAPGY